MRRSRFQPEGQIYTVKIYLYFTTFLHEIEIYQILINLEKSRPTVAEWSKASVLRSWKRKVVGSNPSEAEFDYRFSFGDWVDLIGSIAKRNYRT